MRTAAFLNRMPPYLFAQIDAKRDALEAQGVDVISLGIGDPDTPTPPHIVDAMAEAIRNPAKMCIRDSSWPFMVLTTDSGPSTTVEETVASAVAFAILSVTFWGCLLYTSRCV